MKDSLLVWYKKRIEEKSQEEVAEELFEEVFGRKCISLRDRIACAELDRMLRPLKYREPEVR